MNYFLEKFSAPIPAGFLPHFQSGEQRNKFFAAQPGATAAPVARPGKTALLQPLGANPQSAAIPKQNFDPIARLVGENKPVTRERILLKHRLRQGEQLVETGAQIHWRGRHIHARAAGAAQHTRSSWSSIAAGTALDSRNTVPLGRVSSAAQSEPAANGGKVSSSN